MKRILGGALLLILAQVIALSLLGQAAICECGYVKLWEGVVLSSGNSQHATDWYTFSHIIHGLLFYLALWLLFPRMPIRQRLLIALAVEVGWEILENTPFVIEAYRQQALARGYVGDSIVNSVSDTLAMAVGFLMAWRLPLALIVLIGAGLELFVGFSIRDNLFLNVLGFFWLPDFISNWQASGGG